MQYWLMKSEPDAFSIDDLAKRPKQTEPWDGVRNYQARNWLRDEIKIGDLAFFYHSNCEIPGIAGIIDIVKAGYPDETAFNPDSKYYDPKSTLENPRWYRVDVHLLEKFSKIISLAELRAHPALHNMRLLQKGSRLSIMPVSKQEWQLILAMPK